MKLTLRGGRSTTISNTQETWETERVIECDGIVWTYGNMRLTFDTISAFSRAKGITGWEDVFSDYSLSVPRNNNGILAGGLWWSDMEISE